MIVSLSVEDGYDPMRHGCPSPGAESYLSTGSSGLASADLDLNNQSRFRIPCRLQLVKPLEGCFSCLKLLNFDVAVGIECSRDKTNRCRLSRQVLIHANSYQKKFVCQWPSPGQTSICIKMSTVGTAAHCKNGDSLSQWWMAIFHLSRIKIREQKSRHVAVY